MLDAQSEIVRKMTPGQKVEASMMLYHSAKRFKAAWLRKIHPDWSQSQIKSAVREAFINAQS